MAGGEVRTAAIPEIVRDVPLAGAIILVDSEQEAGRVFDRLHADRGLDICRRCTVFVVGLQAIAGVCASYDYLVGTLGVGDVAFQTHAAVGKIERERCVELGFARQKIVRDAVLGSIILVATVLDGYTMIGTIRDLRPQDRGRIRVITAPTPAAVERVLAGLKDGQLVYRDPVHLAKVALPTQWATWTAPDHDLEFIATLPADRASIVVVGDYERVQVLAERVQQRFGEQADLVNFLVAETVEAERLYLAGQIMPVFYDPQLPERPAGLPTSAPRVTMPEESEAEQALAAKKAAEVETGMRRARLRTGKRRSQREMMRGFVDGLPESGAQVAVASHALAKHIRDVIAVRRPEIQRRITFMVPDASATFGEIAKRAAGPEFRVAPGVSTRCLRAENRRAKAQAEAAPAVADPVVVEDAYLAQAAVYTPPGGYIGLDRAEPPKPVKSFDEGTRPMFAPVPRLGDLGFKPELAGKNQTVTLSRFAERIRAIRASGVATTGRLGGEVTIPGKPPTGWVCPRCDAVLAPHVERCTCKAATAT